MITNKDVIAYLQKLPADAPVFLRARDVPMNGPDGFITLDCALGQIARAQSTPRTFVRWTLDEEQRLAVAFDTGRTTSELAKLHNRSPAAIEARLLKLGKIDVSQLSFRK